MRRKAGSAKPGRKVRNTPENQAANERARLKTLAVWDAFVAAGGTPNWIPAERQK